MGERGYAGRSQALRRIDRLILGELFGLWVFGVAIFSVLIMAGSFLFELTRYLAQGANPVAVIQLVVLLLPGVVAKTFSMAMLLGTLLAFGRLSGDSEIVALRAGGVSLRRIMLPVAIFGTVVFLTAFSFNELLVPQAARSATSLKAEIAAALNGRTDRAATRAIYEEGKLRGYVNAKDFDIAAGTLRDAYVLYLAEDGRERFLLKAPELVYESEQDWRIVGTATLYDLESKTTATIEGAWPRGLAAPAMTPQSLLSQTITDLDALSMSETRQQINEMRADPGADPKRIANLEFGYWNKISLPLAALVFGLVGAPLGIRSHRAGTATGFWLSVIIIFGYMMVTNVMSLFAQGGRLPASAASLTPIGVGLLVAAWLIRKKDQ
ncbi:MAG TPA: hypothetical protein DCY02_08560 [Armatimonadetes bacterium]|nr:hypothetical protein [Armatimonadota bacterium]HCM74591.1 hypothetical protein [Armatimonadota bacterium]